MALQLYDTRRRAVFPFTPRVSGQAGLYVCGPTVQGPPHVGHVRGAVAFDVLRRWLTLSGYEVTLVRNVTDVDDKIIENAAAEGVTPWALAERYTREFNRAYDVLGVLAPTVEPRATGHIPEMIAMIARLVDAGAAYPSAGSVWFSVGAFADYGALSGQRPDSVQASPEGDDGKRDPRDFALWKAYKPGEPSWDTPWGPGRPGWHLECSAMAAKYLGEGFDVHGGGLDLVFPHHENERAQTALTYGSGNAGGSGGSAGTHEMAQHWLHGGMLTTRGEKMSKSVGNFFRVQDALDAVRPAELRFYLASGHYRSTQEYSGEALQEAAAGYQRLETFCRSVDVDVQLDEPSDEPPGVWDEFAEAMDDDLAVPRALAVIFSAVSTGNKAEGSERGAYVRVVRRMLAALGLDPVSQWPDPGSDLRPALDTAVAVALARRAQARQDKDYATSDLIRDQLAEGGIQVEDTAGGQRWRLG
ncbi:MAG: cysteinyl-tRNA synthetase [Frankiaceae bacterium]|nr:cysteinyl-tRNA synthetase [Frankiaceae bacterium]